MKSTSNRAAQLQITRKWISERESIRESILRGLSQEILSQIYIKSHPLGVRGQWGGGWILWENLEEEIKKYGILQEENKKYLEKKEAEFELLRQKQKEEEEEWEKKLLIRREEEKVKEAEVKSREKTWCDLDTVAKFKKWKNRRGKKVARLRWEIEVGGEMRGGMEDIPLPSKWEHGFFGDVVDVVVDVTLDGYGYWTSKLVSHGDDLRSPMAHEKLESPIQKKKKINGGEELSNNPFASFFKK